MYRSNLAVAGESLPLAAPLLKTDRLLVIAPHCDDETLGAGGAIAQARKIGARAQIVFLTNGDGSRSTQLVAQTRALRRHVKLKNLLPQNNAQGNAHRNAHRIGSTPNAGATGNLFQDIAAMRRREALAACAALGVGEKDVLFLGYPDGGTRAMWEKNWSPADSFVSPYTKTARSPYHFSYTKNAPYSGAQVVRDLEKIMREFAPTIVLTTHPADTHPDHWAAFAYSSAALERLRLKPNSKTRPDATRPQLLAFLVHHGVWPAPHGYRPNAMLAPPASLEKCGTRWQSQPLSPSAQNAKKSALEKYASQLVWTPKYLRSFLRRNELFGQVPTATIQNSRLVQDAPSDSIWRDRWPAADIQSLDCQAAPGVLPKQALRLQTRLAGTPSARVHYRFSLHAITATGITAWTIDARRDGDNLRATLQQNGNNRNYKAIVLKGELAPDGFVFDVPPSALGVLPTGAFATGVLPKRAALLVSAATSIGKTRLDQTPTGILRLE